MALLSFMQSPRARQQDAEVMPGVGVSGMLRKQLLVYGQRLGGPTLVFKRKRARKKRLRFVQCQSFLKAAAPTTCVGVWVLLSVMW